MNTLQIVMSYYMEFVDLYGACRLRHSEICSLTLQDENIHGISFSDLASNGQVHEIED